MTRGRESGGWGAEQRRRIQNQSHRSLQKRKNKAQTAVRGARDAKRTRASEGWKKQTGQTDSKQEAETARTKMRGYNAAEVECAM